MRADHNVVSISDNKLYVNNRFMAAKSPQTVAKQARSRIVKIREELSNIEYLCSGTLLERTKMCGRPGCACATDPTARHGPYIEWGHMRGGKLVHRQISAQQALSVRLAIDNFRRAKKLMREWETETERLIDAEQIQN